MFKKKTYPFLLKWSKNFYVLTILLFLAWVLFLDSNDLFTQIKLERQKQILEQEKYTYTEQRIIFEKKHKILLTDPLILERIARERYLLKRKNEDIYIVEDENPSSK